jgi:hypothetical protein
VRDDGWWPEPPNSRISCLGLLPSVVSRAARGAAHLAKAELRRFFVAARDEGAHLSTGCGSGETERAREHVGPSAPA